jgi:hypothetical protein
VFVPQQRGSIILPVKGNGTDLISLAALMITAPADAQTAKKTAGMEIEMQGRNVCRF